VDDGTAASRGWVSFPSPGKHVAFDGRWLHGAPTELLHGASDACSSVEGMCGAYDAGRSNEGMCSSRDAGRSRAGACGAHDAGRSRAGACGAHEAGRSRAGACGAHEAGRSKHKKPRWSRRTSLLVNVWLDHRPGAACRLAAELAAKLTPCLARTPFSLDTPSAVPVLSSGRGGGRGDGRGGGRGGDTTARRGGGRGGGVRAASKASLIWPIAQESEAGCTLHARLPVESVCAVGGAGASVELHLDPGDALVVDG
jgi:hypothetical protein